MNKDLVIKPAHYQQEGGEECIVAMCKSFGVSAVIEFCKLNAYKYLYRQDKKGLAEQDLQKARWYAVIAQLLGQGRHIYTALAYVRSEAYKSFFESADIEKESDYPNIGKQFREAFKPLSENSGCISIEKQFAELLPKKAILHEVIVKIPFKETDLHPVIPSLTLIAYEDEQVVRTYFYA